MQTDTIELSGIAQGTDSTSTPPTILSISG